jgi:hypothetical protein
VTVGIAIVRLLEAESNDVLIVGMFRQVDVKKVLN